MSKSKGVDYSKQPTLPGTPPTGKYIPARVRVAVYKRDQDACFFCGRTKKDGAVLTLDHFIPRALGGTNEEHNL